MTHVIVPTRPSNHPDTEIRMVDSPSTTVAQSLAGGCGVDFCLLGADVTAPNFGVRALALSVAEYVARISPDSRLVLLCPRKTASEGIVMTRHRSLKTLVFNYRLNPLKSFRDSLAAMVLGAVVCRLLGITALRRAISRRIPSLAALEDAAIVADIRGGDSFSDIYGPIRLLAGAAPVLAASLMGTRLLLLPQTYGPFESVLGRWLGRRLLQIPESIAARDAQSVDVVKALRPPPGTPLRLVPDLAFTLPSRPHATSIGQARPVIGLNVSGLLYIGGYTGKNMFGLRDDYPRLVSRLVQTIFRETPYDIVLVPHVFAGTEADTQANKQLLERFGVESDRLKEYSGPKEATALKGLVGNCRALIGSRMHACIAALSQGIPAVGLAYSRKFSGVFAEVDAAELVVDLRRLTSDEAIARVMDLLDREKEFRRRLAQSIPAATRSVEEYLEDALGLSREANGGPGGFKA